MLSHHVFADLQFNLRTFVALQPAVRALTGIKVTCFDTLTNRYGEHTEPEHVATASRLLVHLEDHMSRSVSEHHRPLEPRSLTKAAGLGLGCNLSTASVGKWVLEPDGGSVMWRPTDSTTGLSFCLPPRRGDETKRFVVLSFDVMHARITQPQPKLCNTHCHVTSIEVSDQSWTIVKPDPSPITCRCRRGDETKRFVVLSFDVVHARITQPQGRARVACPLPPLLKQGSAEVVTVQREDESAGDDIRCSAQSSGRKGLGLGFCSHWDELAWKEHASAAAQARMVDVIRAARCREGIVLPPNGTMLNHACCIQQAHYLTRQNRRFRVHTRAETFAAVIAQVEKDAHWQASCQLHHFECA
ncbi:hypothetical protein JKP88DRAFT_253374 [Tribonema minus]|uniref:Uncharacterized protein n=1 Tax=Tribonema minus TaxID=303371 RepID=A0A835Z806_9STRA|nr:hypothetical protein JKP88DRAFT_253374 [Tribonema minus]